MKFTNAILVGAIAVEAASLPQVNKRETLVPVVKGFQMKPFMTALVEAVNDGANLTDILTKPAGLVQSVGAVDVNVTLSLGLTPISSNGRVGAGHEDVSNARVGNVNSNARGGCSNPQLRVEWRNMQPNQRSAFIRSVQCLWNAPPKMGWQGPTTRYEELVYVHQQMVGQVHQSGMFLLWHRYFTHIFARMLREECGLAPNMPFPWWDETRDAGNFAGSGLFTNEYFGALPRVQNGQGQCVTNGPFGSRQIHIGPGSNIGPHCLARGEDTGLTKQVSASFVNSCVAQSTFAKMRECIEYGPHGYGHNGIGPTMADVAASPSDPIFFIHHAFIDRTFKQWQDQAPSRYTDIYACASPANPCPILGLDTVMSAMGIRPEMKVRDYLDTEGTYTCYKYDY